jgi:hypothetical protein
MGRQRPEGKCWHCPNTPEEGKSQCADCARRSRERQRRIRNDKSKCSRCLASPPVTGKRRCQPCADKDNLESRELHRRKRESVLNHYGGVCACCGECRYEFLAIDHIYGGGHQHRKDISRSIHEWLLPSGLPDGYRVLCHNCNCAKGFYGVCPHEAERKGISK